MAKLSKTNARIENPFAWISRLHGARRRVFAYLILTLTMLFLSTNHVIGRATHTEIPPLGLSFWRWLVAGLLLLPLIWPRRNQLVSIYRHRWRPLALLGSVFIGSTAMVLVALNFTTVINVSLINATQPTLTVFFAWLFLHDRLSKIQILGLFAAFAGVAVTLVRGDWHTLTTLQFNGGDLVALLAMSGFATYAVNIRHIPTELNPAEALFGLIVAGCVTLLPFYVAESIFYRLVPLSWTAVGAILLLAVFASVLATLMWNIGNQLVGPSEAGVFINLTPVFGTVLAVLLLAEQLFWFHVVGVLLVGLGIVLVIGLFQRRPDGTRLD